MMNLVRHLSLNKISFILAASFFLLACENEKEEKKYIAKIEDSLLTEYELHNFGHFEKNRRLIKGELVRNWINSEVIKKEADASGIYETKEFIDFLEIQKIKFAESILAEQYVNENYEVPGNFILQSFYDSNKDNFILQDEAFVINFANFSDEQTAVNFRNILVESDWEVAFSKFKDLEFLKYSTDKKFFFQKGFYDFEILNLVNQMEEGETSVIINSEPDNFKIVQVLKKYEMFSLPEFDFITEIVEERYKIKRTQELYKEYLAKLYSKYNVEIKSEE